MWSWCHHRPVSHHTMSPALNNRATSIAPVPGQHMGHLGKKRSMRDQCLYECNYESIDSWSSGSNDSAILKLESSVKSVDSLIEKNQFRKSYNTNNCCDQSGKIQYDSITVLPPPPPLPRTRSFKHYRARTVLPWTSSGHNMGGRSSSAPPISPLHQRKLYNGYER